MRNRIAALGAAAALGALMVGGAAVPLLAAHGQNKIVPYPASPAPNGAPSKTLDLTLKVPSSSPTLVPVARSVPTGEVRAMWIVRDTMTSPQRIKNAVALAKKYRFNTLFVQVRGRGDAFYHSRFEPRSEQLSRQPLDFDPLAVAIEEGHRAGLQVHAWMNTFFVWHQKRRPYSSLHIVNRHPEWLVQDKQGRTAWTQRGDCEGAFLDPAVPGAREHTRNVFLDLVSRYPVDGIHFDYVRFPSEDFSFSDYSLSRFREHMLPALTPHQVAQIDAKRARNRLAWHYSFPGHWRAWRQSLVAETVRSISVESHRMRPGIIVSAAVFPDYNVATRSKGQSWRDWLRDGSLDAACPMTYNRSTQLVAQQIRAAVAAAGGKPIIAGVGAWQMPASSAIAKAKAYRGIGAAGLNFFSYDGMTRGGSTEAYLAAVSAALFPNRVVAAPNWRRPIAAAQRAD